MITTLDDLMTPMTLDEAKATVYAILEKLGVPTTGWRSGAVVRTIVFLVVILCVAFSVIVVALAKGIFRESATGKWLTLHSRDVYGVERQTETFGTGTVTLKNVAGGVYNPTAGDTIIQYTTTGKTYRNVSSYHLGSGTTIAPSTVTIDVVAIEAGSASNVEANAPMTLVTPMSGVSVLANTVILGLDEETNEALRARDDESLDALSPNGPEGAYLAFAKRATRADGTNVGIARAAVSDPSSTGEVTVTVATASGAVGSSDLDLVDDRIHGVTGPGCVPLGVTATVVSAVARTIDITIDLYVYTTDGRTAAEIETAAETILASWVSTRDIGGDAGGKVYLSAIRSKAMSVSSHCYQAAMTLPAADVPIAANEVPTVGSVAVTAHMVTP